MATGSVWLGLSTADVDVIVFGDPLWALARTD
jgi:hypothetical protein